MGKPKVNEYAVPAHNLTSHVRAVDAEAWRGRQRGFTVPAVHPDSLPNPYQRKAGQVAQRMGANGRQRKLLLLQLMMEIGYDPEKYARNIRERGLSFDDVGHQFPR